MRTCSPGKLNGAVERVKSPGDVEVFRSALEHDGLSRHLLLAGFCLGNLCPKLADPMRSFDTLASTGASRRDRDVEAMVG